MEVCTQVNVLGSLYCSIRTEKCTRVHVLGSSYSITCTVKFVLGYTYREPVLEYMYWEVRPQVHVQFNALVV